MKKLFSVLFLSVLFAAVPLSAQQKAESADAAPTPAALQKDPMEGMFKSFIVPGWGQVYAGEKARGYMLFGVAVGAPLAGALVDVATSDCSYSYCTSSSIGLLAGLAGTMAGLGAWMYSVYDAGHAVERANAAAGYKVSGLQVAPEIGIDPRGGTTLGVSVKLGR